MEYGIQRRTIYLLPPADSDLPWFFGQFDLPEIYEMFGFGVPARMRLMRAYRLGSLVVGMIHRTLDRKRIGFIVMFPPAGKFDFWELGYAIEDPRDRDAFSALNTTDAMGHYMFMHLRVPACGWRTRADNRSADAVVRRLGYQPFDSWVQDGHPYTFYRLDTEGWMKRQARLEANELKYPSGTGSAFVTLMPPYEPIPLKGDTEG